MAINFNHDSVFNLNPMNKKEVVEEVNHLLIDGEVIVLAFKTVRDQLIFTNKRIIAVDIQGLTGTKKGFSILPYANIQYFTFQTPSIGELLLADSELYLVFNNGFKTKFEFSGNVDITLLGRVISEVIL